MLDKLPPDIVLDVFKWLDIRSLCRVASVCKYFAKLSTKNVVWKSHLQQQLITNSLHDLSMSNKRICQLSYRWSKGKGKATTVAKFNKNYLPWMQLCRNNNGKTYVYLSIGGQVRQWQCDKKNCLRETPRLNTMFEDVDVTSFRVKQGTLTAVGWKGRMAWCSLDGKREVFSLKAHDVDANAIDHNDNIITTGCHKGILKIWKWGEDRLTVVKTMQLSFTDSILTLHINDRTAAVGTGAKNNCDPLYILDLESGQKSSCFGVSQTNGAGTLDMEWLDHNRLLTSSYDTYIRLWDMRLPRKVVRSWEEPHDNAVYSIASDHGNAFVSGSCRHGVVRLWDIRMRKCLQTFYTSGRINSPVYSIKMTSTRIFVGLAKQFRSLEFF